MPKLHILSTKNSDKQQVEQGIYLIMERFRKLPNYWIGANSSWKSVSYVCLFLCCWIIVDIQISSSIFLEKGFSKDQDGKCILNQSRYSKCYKKILTPSQTTVRSFSSTPIHSRCMYCSPKKLWVWHWQLLGVKKSNLKNQGSPGVVSRGLYLRKYLCTLAVTQITCRFKSLKRFTSPSQNTRNNFGITLFWCYNADFKKIK